MNRRSSSRHRRRTQRIHRIAEVCRRYPQLAVVLRDVIRQPIRIRVLILGLEYHQHAQLRVSRLPRQAPHRGRFRPHDGDHIHAEFPLARRPLSRRNCRIGLFPFGTLLVVVRLDWCPFGADRVRFGGDRSRERRLRGHRHRRRGFRCRRAVVSGSDQAAQDATDNQGGECYHSECGGPPPRRRLLLVADVDIGPVAQIAYYRVDDGFVCADVGELFDESCECDVVVAVDLAEGPGGGDEPYDEVWSQARDCREFGCAHPTDACLLGEGRHIVTVPLLCTSAAPSWSVASMRWQAAVSPCLSWSRLLLLAVIWSCPLSWALLTAAVIAVLLLSLPEGWWRCRWAYACRWRAPCWRPRWCRHGSTRFFSPHIVAV